MNPPEKAAVDQHQAADDTVQEIEARRCHICDCKNPNFGFGPPLRWPEQTLWACGRHRLDVERLVHGPREQRADREPRLL